MGTIHLPQDFKEFFRSFNQHEVEYLLVGGYAVGYHGYPRATIDIDVWVSSIPDNARRIVSALEDFGFGGQKLNEGLFFEGDRVVRMGLPPMRIKIFTSITGVDFEGAYNRRIEDVLDDGPIKLISLNDLKANKKAAGRAKDLADLEELP